MGLRGFGYWQWFIAAPRIFTNSFLVTPASEAESQLLAALFKQMRVKTAVVPAAANGNGQLAKRAAKKSVSAKAKEFVPQNQAEQNMLEAVLELNEVLAGRKKAMSLDEFWKEVSEG